MSRGSILGSCTSCLNLVETKSKLAGCKTDARLLGLVGVVFSLRCCFDEAEPVIPTKNFVGTMLTCKSLIRPDGGIAGCALTLMMGTIPDVEGGPMVTGGDLMSAAGTQA